MDKYEEYVDKWMEKNPEKALEFGFEVRVSQISVALLVKFLVSKNIINLEEYANFANDPDNQIEMFKEIFERSE